MILDMGVTLRLDTPVVQPARRCSTSGGYDAVFVGSGAPKGKELELPGRHDTDRIHIGIAWLESVAFGHIGSIGERVLIIGVGNTAMDCCRTSLRLGARSVKVMARKPRGFFKASDWELEDAEEENVEIIVNHAPRHFVIEDGKLTGMRFEQMEYELGRRRHQGRARRRRGHDSLRRCHPRDRPGERLPLDRARSGPEVRASGTSRWSIPTTFQSTLPRVFFGGDAAQGPKNIIWAVEHGAPGRHFDSSTTASGGSAGRAPGQHASSSRAARWACTNGPTRTTTRRSSGG